MSVEINQMNLTQVQVRLEEIKDHPTIKKYRQMEPHYATIFTASSMIPRITVVALFVIGIVALGLLMSGHLFTFPQDFVHFFQQLSAANLTIGLSVTICLLSGAFAIIHFARTTKENLLAPLKLIQTIEGNQIEMNGFSVVPRRKTIEVEQDTIYVCCWSEQGNAVFARITLQQGMQYPTIEMLEKRPENRHVIQSCDNKISIHFPNMENPIQLDFNDKRQVVPNLVVGGKTVKLEENIIYIHACSPWQKEEIAFIRVTYHPDINEIETELLETFPVDVPVIKTHANAISIRFSGSEVPFQLDLHERKECHEQFQASDQMIKMTYLDEQAPSRGAITNMEGHLETVLLENIDRDIRLDAYLDRSTLDANGDGKAFLYHTKRAEDHYMIASIVAILGTPVYLVGVVVYNLLRAVIVPLYVCIRLLQEAWIGKPIYEKEGWFEVKDIGIEFVQSIKRAVQAPFYALAYWMSVIYALVNPMGGRKLAAAIERDWNDGMTIEEGYWSVQGEQKFWQFEGGGGPKRLGKNGFFLTGCYLPIGIAEVKDGVIHSYWIAAMTNPNKFVPYSTTTLSEIEPKFTPLNQEYNALLARKKELLSSRDP